MNTSAKNLEFSYSRMNMYKECPRRYKFRYIERIPEKPKYYFAFGHSIHSSLEFLYNVKSPPFPSLNDVLKVFEKDWKSKSYEEKGYLYPQREEADFQKGLDILAKYYKKHEKTLHIPLSVEFRTKLAIDGLNVTIVVDRIDYLGDGKIAIVDYKTGKSIVNNTDQLFMYQKILESSPALIEMITEKYGDFINRLEVNKMVFYYVNSLTEKTHNRADSGKINTFWQEVLKVADNIRDRKFTATPSEKCCRYCDYKLQCSAASGKSIPPSSDTKIICNGLSETTDENKDVLDGKIEKYAKLLSDLSKITSEIKSLKNEITLIMQERKLTKHFTKNYETDLVRTSRTQITDKQKLLKLLKDFKLLGRTLAPTKTGVEKLLTDPEVSEDAKKEIKKFFKTAGDFDIRCKRIEE